MSSVSESDSIHTIQSCDANQVLAYFRQLAELHERPSTDRVLQELAQLFNATAVGVGFLKGTGLDIAFSPVTNYPWQADETILNRARNSCSAVTHRCPRGAWLLSHAGGGERLAWAFRAGANDWTSDDAWCWQLASQSLRHWLDVAHPEAAAMDCLRQRLEHAAIVTSRLSHDFGNYLTGIMGFTELSLSHAAPDTALHRYLSEVLQAAKQGADWIRRLHLFCRHSTAPAWPALLSSVLAEEESRLRSAGVSGLRWETKVPDDLPLLAIDAGSLQTALAELVDNTRAVTKNQGTISFAAQAVELTATTCRELLGSARPGKYVEITIADDGPGFDPEVRERLSREIFFSTKPRQRGLGFLVVFGVMQRCRGGMRACEPGPGPGACVRLYVPAAAIEGPKLTAKNGVPHVLLVHANPVLFESIRKILEAHGCRVSMAAGSPSALGVYASPGQSFALVVTETTLPHMSGFDLARRILDHDANANFLFLHTQASFHGLAEEDLLKRFDMLRWPLQPQDLLRAVHAALEKAATKSPPEKSSR